MDLTSSVRSNLHYCSPWDNAQREGSSSANGPNQLDAISELDTVVLFSSRVIRKTPLMENGDQLQIHYFVFLVFFGDFCWNFWSVFRLPRDSPLLGSFFLQCCCYSTFLRLLLQKNNKIFLRSNNLMDAKTILLIFISFKKSTKYLQAESLKQH